MKCLNLFFSKNETFKYRKNTFKSLFTKVFEVKKILILWFCVRHTEKMCAWHMEECLWMFGTCSQFFFSCSCVFARVCAHSHKARVFPRCVRGPAETRMALADGSLNASFTDPLQMKLCSTINSKSVAKNPFTVSKLVNWPWKAKPKTLPKQPLSIPMLTHFAKQERPAEAPLQIALGI